MRVIGRIGVLTAWAAWSIASSTAEGEPRSVQSGVYTKSQAEEGRKVFGEACASCHPHKEFSQGGYMDGWTGMTVNDFLGLVRSTMPQDNPGRLKQSEYIAIAAFLFEINGVPTGDTEMDGKAIKEIRIEGPFTAKDED